MSILRPEKRESEFMVNMIIFGSLAISSIMIALAMDSGNHWRPVLGAIFFACSIFSVINYLGWRLAKKTPAGSGCPDE